MPHIAVIGAGITGVTTAYALLERSYSVTVIERQRYAAMETSFANGGQLSASNAEVWNHWSTMLKGIKWMMRRDAPLLMNPAPTWHKYSWLAEFVSNIANYRQNTVKTTQLAIEARKHLFAIAEREKIDFNHVCRGILHVYWDKSSFQHALKVNSMLVEGGLDRRPVTASEIKSIEPALHGSFHAGFYTPSDSTGDIHKFTSGLAKACERRGANFVFDATVESIVRDGKFRIGYTRNGLDGPSEEIDVDGIVVCAGLASRHFAKILGDRVNVYPVKGYSITVDLEDDGSQGAAPWVSLLDDRAKIVTSRLGPDRFRVAGTAEFNGANRDIRNDRVAPLVEWMRTLFPAVDTHKVVPWAGLRPMMPNMMPRIGKGRQPGVFYNTGHGHLGWTLSAVTAQMVAESVSAQFNAGAAAA
ncbi:MULTISPECIES: D-amino acid dehydrogenase [unclassified Mesorhizobium]|uniref:D-amino acid dehydrogenase n=1 Tax=unclassified Mesorhizobium TaxID=325217 RepID=UPI0024157F69|nr:MULTISPECIES: D-amino acid dehydrogenase [unclassified Mesorhizobium]MDG4889876.1 D-amino acid dehydrogenase [Mesorhizobium sp. WSM4887]MDG4904019.1 D-amino acid dehydrogenase [Mesorhizobium sp. WSM4962]MDG4909046.1 D-amino acid dehydrogenase [Mesorhizobium sp. WSM4898]MDG4921670.1 D-amino acid dehydrogenase [Mesorhizobium sp. WSM4989]